MDLVLQKLRYDVAVKKRPMGITMLAIVMMVAGLAFAVTGVNFFLMGAGAISGEARGLSAELAGMGAAAGIIFLLFGLLHILFAIGLMQMRDAARLLAILLFGLSVVGAAIGAVITLTQWNPPALGWDVLVLMIDVFVIRYLSHPHVKHYFDAPLFRAGKPLRGS